VPKMVRRLSSNTTLRGGTPTSPSVAEKFMNFRFNHARLHENGLPTKLGSADSWRNTNASGKSDNRGVGEAFGSGGFPWTDYGTVKNGD
jgi:hypothetical protein